jgi:integrase
LRQWLKFAVDSGWLQRNPASAIKPGKIDRNTTVPLEPEEYERALSFAHKPKIQVLLKLLRYSGLRISDASCLSRASLRGDRVFLAAQQKTQEPVTVLLPPDVAKELRAIPNSNPGYFFWTGIGKRQVHTTNMRDEIGQVFRKAGLKGGAHRLRDTFAVELLASGASLVACR